MLGYFGPTDTPQDKLALTRAAEDLGFTVAWTAESYGSDAATFAAWLAGQTSTIELGTAIMQIPARTPAATAMTAVTIDALSGGRFRLGLGVSGPQVSEGWHGVRFAKPVTRSREYLTIVRDAIAREVITHEGEFFTLPLPDGPGKALKLNMRPLRTHIPTYLASVGPRSLELCGELADGWLAVFFDSELGSEQVSHLRIGRERAGLTMDGFDIVAHASLRVGDSIEQCADAVRPGAALYVGGMGSKKENYYNRMCREMGFDDEAEQIQQLYLSGRKAEAEAAVPLEYISRTALVGPVETIAERLQQLADAGVTTCAVTPLGASTEDRIAMLTGLAEAHRMVS